jgi:alpha-amylase
MDAPDRSVFQNEQPVSFLTDLLKEQQITYPAKAKQLYFTTNHDENSWNGTEYEKYGVYANALAVFNFVYPGSVPLIYCGQEIPNHKRLAFFDKDEIVWNDHPALQHFYTQLVAFRKNCKASDTLTWIESQPGLLAFRRGDHPSVIYLFINLGKDNITVSFPSSDNQAYRYVLSNKEEKLITASDNIQLKPGEYLLLENN